MPTLLAKVIHVSQSTPDFGVIPAGASRGTAASVVHAGAHINVHLPDGVIRNYSLYNHSNSGHYLIAVKQESGLGGHLQGTPSPRAKNGDLTVGM